MDEREALEKAWQSANEIRQVYYSDFALGWQAALDSQASAIREALKEVYDAYVQSGPGNADFIWDEWAEKAERALAAGEQP